MSYFRSYFSKNNTILGLKGGSGLPTNTAKNPNTEIYYGGAISKFIFQVDLDSLKDAIDNGEYVINSDTKHILHLTNTIFGDERFLGAVNPIGKDRATSFDLIVFELNEYWDEGVGFDYSPTSSFIAREPSAIWDSIDNKWIITQGNETSAIGNKTYDERPSNWEWRTTLEKWDQQGIYIITPANIIATIHFDNGDENLEADVTTYINSILTGGTTNYGLGVAFEPGYMALNNVIDQSVSFFTKYTQTFFEPYVETIFDDNIQDDRENFCADMTNCLYLYVTKGTNYFDLDYLPTVDIMDSAGNVISGLSGLTTEKVRKGIYKVCFGLTGTLCEKKKFFFDKWKNLWVDGTLISDVTQKFIPVPYTEGITIGANPTELQRYVVQFFGVKLNEKIKRGSIRKIVVTFRSINIQRPVLFSDVYYRLYVREGNTEVDIFDWTKLDRTNENAFWLNTSYLIPREYYLEIKGKTHTEEIYYTEDIKFEIVSEK